MADEENKPEGTSENVSQPGEQVTQPSPTVQEQPATPENVQSGQPDQAQPPEEATVPEQQVQAETSEPKGRGKKWAIILSVVLVVGIGAVVVGFISGRKARDAQKQQREERVVHTPVVEEKDALTEQYNEISTSDEITDIEADLNATSFEGLDKELTDIDKELIAEE